LKRKLNLERIKDEKCWDQTSLDFGKRLFSTMKFY